MALKYGNFWLKIVALLSFPGAAILLIRTLSSSAIFDVTLPRRYRICLIGPAISLDEKYRICGQNIMDFLSFTADVKDNVEFRVFVVSFLDLALS